MADFIIGDYKYTTLNEPNTVNVKVVDTSKASYGDIPSSVTYGGVEYSVTSMNSCFRFCKSLTQAPAIPNSVTSMNLCFRFCESLTQAPAIPDSVTNMYACFYECTSLTTAPVIPDSVTNIRVCFARCTSLTTAPTIPDSVTNMYACFGGCTSLTQAPVIPSSVTDMEGCFGGCTSLTQAPVIPSSVTDMEGCFDGCVNLEGDVYVYAKGFSYRGAFYDTTKPIIIHSMNENVDVCQQLASTASNGNVYVNIHPETPISFTDTQMNYMTNEGLRTLSLQTNANLVQCEIPDLVNGGTITTNVNDALIDLYQRRAIVASNLTSTANNNNVIFGGLIDSVTPTLLNTRRLIASENATYGTTNGYRVDMLLNGDGNGIAEGVVPSTMTLYTMDDIEITYPYRVSGALRCYGVASYTTQIPTNNITVAIQSVGGENRSATIGLPSTATPTQIKQEGQTDPISPTIDVTNVRFNPETTGLNKYTVGDAIGVTTTNMTKAQTNVDNDVKHIVTHASNVRISNTTTLQDWITEQYNNLT